MCQFSGTHELISTTLEVSGRQARNNIFRHLFTREVLKVAQSLERLVYLKLTSVKKTTIRTAIYARTAILEIDIFLSLISLYFVK